MKMRVILKLWEQYILNIPVIRLKIFVPFTFQNAEDRDTGNVSFVASCSLWMWNVVSYIGRRN
jgi:hypothetical protein